MSLNTMLTPEDRALIDRLRRTPDLAERRCRPWLALLQS